MIKKSLFIMLISLIALISAFTNGNDEKKKNGETKTEQGTAEQGKGNADVLFVRASQQGNGTWTFDVTVKHPDTGWDNYADGWDVYLEDGTVLKPDVSSPFTRLLLHPHVGEQPFTRSEGGIVIPKGVAEVYVRAHDIVDGWGGRVVKVGIAAGKGKNYEVIRK